MSKIKIQKKSLVTICCIIALVTILMAGIIFMIPEAYALNPEENIANLTEQNYSFTNSDTPNGVNIAKYANLHYGKNATLERKNNNQNITIKDSDDIIKIIPMYMFKVEGITQHIGKQYGFFIETRKPIKSSNMLLSTVVIVDVTNSDNMYSPDSKSHLKIELKPVFQADFAYVKRGDTESFCIGEQFYDFFSENYLLDLTISYPATGNEFVIPVPTLGVGNDIEFLQHNKYYMTELSNQTSLYNGNHPNIGEDGYVASQDMGCFFSQIDFSYDGIFLENGKTTVADVGSVVYNATSLGFDIIDMAAGLKSVWKAVPYVGAVVTGADIAMSILRIIDDLKTQTISSSKTLSYTPYYNNKDQQIASSGGLRKDAAIVIQSAENKELLFGTNHSATFDFQINCQDISVDTRYATMINVGFKSVVGKSLFSTEFGEVHRSTSVYSNDLRNHIDANYKEIPKLNIGAFKSNADIKILPNCEGMLELAPEFSGKYNIKADNTYSKFSIYEVNKLSNGVLDYKDTSTLVCRSTKKNGIAQCNDVFLDKNKFYLLKADLKDKVLTDNIHGRYGKINVEAELIKKDIFVGENNIDVNLKQEYLKFTTEHNVNYRFTIQDSTASIKLLDNNFGVVKSSSNGSLVATLNAGETYYLRIDRAEASVKKININVNYEMYVYFENIQGISGSIVQGITVVNGETVNLPTPSKVGYTLDSWWTSLDSLGEKVTNNNIFNFVCPELHLYAKWSPIQYTIYYEENGAGEIPNGNYIIEHEALLNQNISRAGYVFCGWYSDSAFSGQEIVSIPAGSIGERTFYAKWVKDTFSVSFDLNAAHTDGVGANIEALKKNVGFRQSYNLPVPTLGGFVFEGWYKDNIKYTDNDGRSLSNYNDECDITLTARWAREKYYISINAEGKIKWLTKDGDNFTFSNDKTFVESEIGLCPNCYIARTIALGGQRAEQMKQYLFKEGHRYAYMIKDKNDPSSLACWQGAELGVDYNDGDTIEIYAHHTPELNFKIKFENGRQFEANYGIEIQYENIKKDGHTFSHFIVSKDSRNNKYINTHLAPGTVFGAKYMPDLSIGVERDGDEIYLEAVFIPNTYTVTLYNGNQTFSQKNVIFGKPCNTSSNNAFPVPYKTGYVFDGWTTGVNGTGNLITDASGNTLKDWYIASNCSLYAKWTAKQYRVTLDAQGGSGGSTVIVTYDEAMPKTNLPTRLGYSFKGYFTGGNGSGVKYYDNNMNSVMKWTNDYGTTLYAYWEIINYTITYEGLTGHWGDLVPVHIKNPNEERTTYTINDHVIFENPTLEGLELWWDTKEIPRGSTGNKTINLMWREHKYTIYLKAEGIKVDDTSKEVFYSDIVTIKYNTKAKFSKWTLNGVDYSTSEEITVTKLTSKDKGSVTLVAYYTSECVAEGTMITLADGTQKPVESLTGDELLLVWNLKTGKFDAAPILFIDSDARKEYEVINLYFSDGTTVKVISEHAFWDVNLNQYVFLRSDAAQYIGHRFNKQTVDADGNLTWITVQLTDVVVAKEITTAWSPVTAEHLCYYVNGMLSMPGGTTGLINIFEVDPETMQYDMESMQADIAEYGLFTYEEFAELYPISEDVFEAFGGQYLKIAIGKGILTEEMLNTLIERYAKFL